MAETVFDELKRYVGWTPLDEDALRVLGPTLGSEFERISVVFYDRILAHPGARTALEGGERQVGHLKITLQAWMKELFDGPWDDAYYERRARIGRKHVRISLPQHYMFGAMNVLRLQLGALVPEAAREALGKILDLELGIMLHTYREDLLSQQARVERLATFGQLVGSLGHELRNPLGVIETSLYVLKGRASGDEREAKHLNRMGEQVQVANDIITQLLDMIRDRPLQRQPVSLPAVVEQARLAVAFPADVSLELELDDALPLLDADPSQLRQVFVNLVENAVHAASPKGFVRIAAHALPATTPPLVEVSVEDSGPGVDPAIRGRLFEPLVTTKAKGIGLGLALVRRIVERHGGTLRYAPRATGARFLLTLPAGKG